jgi:hypothetical protein
MASIDRGVSEMYISRSAEKVRHTTWFTEGFDTLDLKEAKVLLDELHT